MTRALRELWPFEKRHKIGIGMLRAAATDAQKSHRQLHSHVFKDVEIKAKNLSMTGSENCSKRMQKINTLK